jgi:hypothetical protein
MGTTESKDKLQKFKDLIKDNTYGDFDESKLQDIALDQLLKKPLDKDCIENRNVRQVLFDEHFSYANITLKKNKKNRFNLDQARKL